MRGAEAGLQALEYRVLRERTGQVYEVLEVLAAHGSGQRRDGGQMLRRHYGRGLLLLLLLLLVLLLMVAVVVMRLPLRHAAGLAAQQRVCNNKRRQDFWYN